MNDVKIIEIFNGALVLRAEKMSTLEMNRR